MEWQNWDRPLWAAVTSSVGELGDNADAIKTGWDGFFAVETSEIEGGAFNGAVPKLEQFRSEGNKVALGKGIVLVLEKAEELIGAQTPQETSPGIVAFLSGISDLVQANADGWELVDNGDSSAATAVVRGVTTASNAFCGTNGDTLRVVVGIIDEVMGDLTSTMAQFRQRLLEAKCCYKRAFGRERQKPTDCSSYGAGYYYNGNAHCYPESQNLLEVGSGREKVGDSLAESVKRKGDQAPKGAPGNARPAHCPTSGDFQEKIGNWCYADCPANFQASGTVCRTECNGAFPHSSEGGALRMCAQDPAALTEAQIQMGMAVIQSVVQIWAGVSVMVNDQAISTEPFMQCLTAVKNLALAFTFPSCPPAPP